MSEDGNSPLLRWSERKALARKEEETLQTVADEALPEEPSELAALEEEDTPAEVVEPLPDIDSLTKDSDYTVFMGKGVPEHLKRLALRKLWRSDPLLAGVDGLVDYGEDFTTSELMGDAVKTIYRVGKGLVEDAEKLAEDEDLGDGEDEELGDGEDEGEGEGDVEIAQPAPDDDIEPVDKG